MPMKMGSAIESSKQFFIQSNLPKKVTSIKQSPVLQGHPNIMREYRHDITEILLKVALNTVTLIRYCTTVDVSLLMFTHVFLTFLTTIHPLTFVMFALFLLPPLKLVAMI
jgi:hypothetical protein